MKLAIVSLTLGVRTLVAQPSLDPPVDPIPPEPAAQPSPFPTPVSPPSSPVASASEITPPAAAPVLRTVDLHGFVSEGAFVSTANNYLGKSARGSMRLFEAGINVSTEPADRLRVGAQLFTRDLANDTSTTVGLDWAFLDYSWRDWLGIRAGRTKVPFGLYNEYQDIDSARTAILLPQSVYPIEDRDILLAQNGITLYGDVALGRGGALDYQAFLGTINVASTAPITSTDVHEVSGGQLFWRTPLDGLRVGASLVHANLSFALQFDAVTTAGLIATGKVPADFTGSASAEETPVNLSVGSAEYVHGDWLFAAEYSRWQIHFDSTIPMVVPSTNSDSERYYGMATYRLSDRFEGGAYYSVYNVDVHDRSGHSAEFVKPFYAFQRDAAATFRFDINSAWLLKLEAHFIDGTGDLVAADNPNPTRYWGMFMARTTVSF